MSDRGSTPTSAAQAEDDLRSAMAEITDKALPPASQFFSFQERARVQVEIMNAVVGLNKSNGLWYQRWRKLCDEINVEVRQ